MKIQRNIPLLYMNSFLMGLIFVIPVWVAFYRRFLDFSQMSLLFAFSALFTILLELPTGALADILGRKRCIAIGLIMQGIMLATIAFTTDTSVFIICLVMNSLGAALVSGADSAISYDTFKELGKTGEFPKFKAIAGMIHRGALAVATFVGGWMYLQGIWLPYFSFGVAMILAGLVYFFFVIEPHIDSQKFSAANYLTQTKQGVRELFKNKHVTTLTFYYMLAGGISWVFLDYLREPLLTNFNLSVSDIAIVVGISYVVSSIVIYVLASRSMVKKGVFYIVYPLVMAVTYLPILLYPVSVIVLIAISIQLSGSARFTFLDAYVNDEFDSKNRATALSGLNMLVAVTTATIIFSAGRVQDSIGTKFVVCVIGLTALLILLPLRLRLRRDLIRRT